MLKRTFSWLLALALLLSLAPMAMAEPSYWEAELPDGTTAYGNRGSSGRVWIDVYNADGTWNRNEYYDTDGTYVVTRGQKGGVTKTEYYNAENQLTGSSVWGPTFNVGVDRESEYDANGNLTGYWLYSKTQEGYERVSRYNADDTLNSYNIYYDTPDGSVHEFYNAKGNMIRYMVSTTNADGLPRVNTYEPDGTLSSYTVEDGNTTSTYDSEGWLLEYEVYDPQNLRTTHYDAEGNMTDWYQYDKSGNLVDSWHMERRYLEWWPHNTATTFGLSVRDLKPEVTDKWYNVTPIDLSKDGETKLDLWASNVYMIGIVTVKVEGDNVTVTYNCPRAKSGLLRTEKEFFTFFKDFDSITTMEPDELGEGYKFGQTLSIEKDLMGNKTPLLFVRNTVTYLTNGLTRLWPNLPHRRVMRDNMMKMIGR